jgi:hypothetical protein
VGIHAYCGGERPKIGSTIQGAFPDHYFETFKDPLTMTNKPAAGVAEDAIKRHIVRQNTLVQTHSKTVFFGIPIIYLATMETLGTKPGRTVIQYAQLALRTLDLLIVPFMEAIPGISSVEPWYVRKGGPFQETVEQYIYPVFDREKIISLKQYVEILRGAN